MVTAHSLSDGISSAGRLANELELSKTEMGVGRCSLVSEEMQSEGENLSLIHI